MRGISNVDLFSNSVRVHFFGTKKLREALGYDPISNKVGEGYCFKEDSMMTKISEIIPKPMPRYVLNSLFLWWAYWCAVALF